MKSKTKTYTVCMTDFYFKYRGAGFTMFDGCKLLKEDFIEDDEAVIQYLTEDLAGTVGEEYEDPYGQGRIVAE